MATILELQSLIIEEVGDSDVLFTSCSSCFHHSC